jgi:hypothetical protein
VSAKSGDSRSGSLPREASSPQPAATSTRPGATSGASHTASSTQPAEDVALVCGVTEDGQGVEVIRKRGERIETGTVRRLEAGKPIHGEVVRLRPRAHAPFVCDVEVELAAPSRPDPARDDRAGAPALGAGSGPAQVATESYRKNWDAVYGRSRKPSLLN